MKEFPYRYYYKPHGAAAADFIPFFHDGLFRLFYLHDWRDAAQFGEGTPWFLLESEDFVGFTECGEVVPRGTPEEQDLYIFTGSVLREENAGRFHLFYTAHNPHKKPAEMIAHAVSRDLVHWDKLPGESFGAEEGFDGDNLRDPFVFYDTKEKLYRLALVKRRGGGSYTAGLVGQYVSPDLFSWRPAEPFWEPALYHTHECPDIFRMGDWWYLLYSEYSDRSLTRYAMARDLQGPWTIPDDDAFDGRAFYAAKTASDGERRYLFGWIPTREGDDDNGGWQWGGNLGVTELFQRSDGTLAAGMPEKSFARWKKERDLPPVRLFARGMRRDALLSPDAGEVFLLSGDLVFPERNRSFSLILGADRESLRGYKFEISPGEDRVRFGRTDRAIREQGLSRPLPKKRPVRIRFRLVRDHDVAVLYLDQEIVLSARLCSPEGGAVLLSAVDGELSLENSAFYTL